MQFFEFVGNNFLIEGGRLKKVDFSNNIWDLAIRTFVDMFKTITRTLILTPNE